MGLGQGHSVQGSVELAISGATEPMPRFVRRPDRHGRGAVMARERVLGSESVDARGLTDDLRRGDRTTVWNRDQRRRHGRDESGELFGQLSDVQGEGADAFDELAGQASDGADGRGDAGSDLVQHADAVQ